jgi:hypothetical protein
MPQDSPKNPYYGSNKKLAEEGNIAPKDPRRNKPLARFINQTYQEKGVPYPAVGILNNREHRIDLAGEEAVQANKAASAKYAKNPGARAAAIMKARVTSPQYQSRMATLMGFPKKK